MKLYYPIICDHAGEAVQELELVGTSRHAAWNANEFINHVPPAQGFKIGVVFYTAHEIATLINKNNTKHNQSGKL